MAQSSESSADSASHSGVLVTISCLGMCLEVVVGVLKFFILKSIGLLLGTGLT